MLSRDARKIATGTHSRDHLPWRYARSILATWNPRIAIEQLIRL